MGERIANSEAYRRALRRVDGAEVHERSVPEPIAPFGATSFRIEGPLFVARFACELPDTRFELSFDGLVSIEEVRVAATVVAIGTQHHDLTMHADRLRVEVIQKPVGHYSPLIRAKRGEIVRVKIASSAPTMCSIRWLGAETK